MDVANDLQPEMIDDYLTATSSQVTTPWNLPVACPICGIVLSRKFCLDRHMNHKHNNDTIKDAYISDDEQSSETNEVQAIKTSGRPLPSDLKYNESGPSAVYNSAPTPDKDLTATSSQPNSLPFACPICGNVLCSKFSLDRHIKLRHKKTSTVNETYVLNNEI